MKKYIIGLLAFFALSALCLDETEAKTYHLFFISQEQSFNVGGTDYQAWVVNSGGNAYYFMKPGSPRPANVKVRNIAGVLASSGGYDMLYMVTRNQAVYIAGTEAVEFAGGSPSSVASAWISFVILSATGQAAHSQFPAGAGFKLVIPVRWLDESDNLQTGNVNDWIAAGYPLKGLHFEKKIAVLGIE